MEEQDFLSETAEVAFAETTFKPRHLMDMARRRAVVRGVRQRVFRRETPDYRGVAWWTVIADKEE